MRTFSFHYLAALLTIGSCLAGCAPPPQGHLVIAIDVSDQDQQRLLRYADLAFKSQRQFATFSCIIYGSDADLIYEGHLLHDRSRFNAAVAGPLTKPRPGMAQLGTNHCLALELAAATQREDTKATLVLTDGGEEDQAGSIASGLDALSQATPLFIFGVLPEHRDGLVSAVRTSFQNAVIRSLADADPALLVNQR